MAPITLIIGKHWSDQTEDKEAIQILSYKSSGIYFTWYIRDYGKQTVVLTVRNKLAHV